LLLNVWTGDWNNATSRYQRPVFMWLKEFLRWTSADTDTAQFRNGIRPCLGVTLPVAPSNEYSVQGVQAGIYITNQGMVTALRQGYNIQGKGSANFNLTSAYDSLFSPSLTIPAGDNGIIF